MNPRAALILLFLLVTFLPGVAAAEKNNPTNYTEQITAWRQQREEKLKQPYGWLSLAGLFWLQQGDNSCGSSKQSRIRLPESAPKEIGRFQLRQGEVLFIPVAGVDVRLNGKPITKKVPVHYDGPGNELQVGAVKMLVIKRSKGIGIRVKDPRSKVRQNFTGLAWYPIQGEFRIQGRWIPRPEAQQVSIANILGGVESWQSPGSVEFSYGGKPWRLLALKATGDKLIFIFKDGTSGKNSYPGGRFLYAEPPVDGKLILDFNRAYNPPCAYAKYTTCPLPPRENWLALEVAAGEKYKGSYY